MNKSVTEPEERGSQASTNEPQANTEQRDDGGEPREEAAAEREQPSPTEALAEKEQEVAALRDQLLRLAADFENFRKRARREHEEIRRFGIESLLADILPVLDNFDRALAHAAGEDTPFVQGVRMVAKQFHDTLGRYGVQSFSSVGERFDPERHEAVGQAPGGDVEAGTVLEEVQKGYLLHDRLLRPARVVVAAAQTDQEDASEASPASD